MTLLTHSVDMFLAELVRDYLTAGHAGKLDEEIGKELMDGIKEPERPVIIVTAKEEAAKGSSRRVIVVNPILATWARSAEAGAAEVAQQTTREDASAIIRELDNRMRDVTAFQTWLSALSAERRAGFSIQKIVHEGLAAPMQAERDTRTVYYSFTVRFHLIVSRSV